MWAVDCQPKLFVVLSITDVYQYLAIHLRPAAGTPRLRDNGTTTALFGKSAADSAGPAVTGVGRRRQITVGKVSNKNVFGFVTRI